MSSLMYEFTRPATVEELQWYKQLAEDEDRVQWQDYITGDRHWQKGTVKAYLPWWEGYVSAFFVKLPAKVGHLHRHADRDLQRRCPIKSYNIVIDNNPLCISGWWLDPRGPMMSEVLQAGNVYLTDRDLYHESWNHGETDRLHLLVEMPRT